MGVSLVSAACKTPKESPAKKASTTHQQYTGCSFVGRQRSSQSYRFTRATGEHGHSVPLQPRWKNMQEILPRRIVHTEHSYRPGVLTLRTCMHAASLALLANVLTIVQQRASRYWCRPSHRVWYVHRSYMIVLSAFPPSPPFRV